MQGFTSRCSAALIRTGLVVFVAVAVVALTPRTASAEVLICNGQGACLHLSGGCGSWGPMPDGFYCFLIGTAVMAPDPRTHLTRDGRGGASIMIAGKSSSVIFASDASAAPMANKAERGRRGGIDKAALASFQRAFDAVARSADRKVTDGQLAMLSKGLKLPIVGDKPKS